MKTQITKLTIIALLIGFLAACKQEKGTSNSSSSYNTEITQTNNDENYWVQAVKAHTVQGYENYISSSPSGSHVAEARQNITSIKEEEERKRIEALKAEEEKKRRYEKVESLISSAALEIKNFVAPNTGEKVTYTLYPENATYSNETKKWEVPFKISFYAFICTIWEDYKSEHTVSGKITLYENDEYVLTDKVLNDVMRKSIQCNKNMNDFGDFLDEMSKKNN